MGYIYSCGLEVELFGDQVNVDRVRIASPVRLMNEVGKFQWELATPVTTRIDDAVALIGSAVLELRQAGHQITLLCARPKRLRSTQSQWHAIPRAEAIVAAYAAENPNGWQLVRRIADFSAVHVNLGGSFNPFGNTGAFLVSVFNYLAPFIAAQIHRELRHGYGHLEIWQGFADPARLPHYGLWFAAGGDMQQQFESLPCLAEKRGGEWVSRPGRKQSMANSDDLGMNRWFLRPRIGDYGNYIECRWLPAMGMPEIRRYANLTVNIIEFALDWFYGVNDRQPVTSLQYAAPFIAAMHRRFPGYIPATVQTESAWLAALKE